MVKFYIMRISKGQMTVDEVPNLWRKKVEEELERLDNI